MNKFDLIVDSEVSLCKAAQETKVEMSDEENPSGGTLATFLDIWQLAPHSCSSSDPRTSESRTAGPPYSGPLVLDPWRESLAVASIEKAFHPWAALWVIRAGSPPQVERKPGPWMTAELVGPRTALGLDSPGSRMMSHWRVPMSGGPSSSTAA